MQVFELKNEKRFGSRNDKNLGIQTYGDNNAYPQETKEIKDASITGKSCVSVYHKFISGKGFFDKKFYKKIINSKGETNDHLLNEIAKDVAEYGGFAIHVNYNANCKIVELQHVPFETVRFEKMDENGDFTRVAIHPDWGRQYTMLRRWRKEDILFFDLFNPDAEAIRSAANAAGGWESYNGQIFYYSNEGTKTYPLPVYDDVVTDMNTEEGISNVLNRNARNNFLSAGMLVDYVNNPESEEQESQIEKSFKRFQGDKAACKIMYIPVKSKEETPEFKSFKGENYDKEFDFSDKAVSDKIGRAFNQPPILRAQDVGSNFGADLMKNAYTYYNSVTYNERLVIERTFTELFQYWHETISTDNFEIAPLSYDAALTPAEELGEKGVEQLLKIVEFPTLLPEQKKSMIKTLFALDNEVINNLITE